VTDPKTANAFPFKKFFIDMLTKDISPQSCILDLVDNSLHSLIARQKLDMAAGFYRNRKVHIRGTPEIHITMSADKLVVRDTCGGIERREAEEHVFRFGKAEVDEDTGGLGVYGIGMKRAIFKMGTYASVNSKTRNDLFQVDMDIPKW